MNLGLINFTRCIYSKCLKKLDRTNQYLLFSCSSSPTTVLLIFSSFMNSMSGFILAVVKSFILNPDILTFKFVGFFRASLITLMYPSGVNIVSIFALIVLDETVPLVVTVPCYENLTATLFYPSTFCTAQLIINQATMMFLFLLTVVSHQYINLPCSLIISCVSGSNVCWYNTEHISSLPFPPSLSSHRNITAVLSV